MTTFSGNVGDNALLTAQWAASRMDGRADEAAAAVRAAAQNVKDAVDDDPAWGAFGSCRAMSGAGMSTLVRAQYTVQCGGWSAKVTEALSRLSTALLAAGDAGAAETSGSAAEAVVNLSATNANVLDPGGPKDWWGNSPLWVKGGLALAAVWIAATIIGGFRGR